MVFPSHLMSARLDQNRPRTGRHSRHRPTPWTAGGRGGRGAGRRQRSVGGGAIMRYSGFSNGAGILATLSLLILAGPATPMAQEGREPAAASESSEAVGASLSEEIRALREELRVAKAQIQILKSTIDAVAASSAAQAALALAK